MSQDDLNLRDLQREHDVTHQVLSKLRDNPNSHISNLQSQVAMLSNKLEPMLEKVEQAQRNIEIAKATHGGRLSQDGGQIGMLSKMGGRMMHYYSDDLTELLLDDIL